LPDPENRGLASKYQRKGGEEMALILLWLLGAPLGIIILLFLLGVGR